MLAQLHAYVGLVSAPVGEQSGNRVWAGLCLLRPGVGMKGRSPSAASHRAGTRPHAGGPAAGLCAGETRDVWRMCTLHADRRALGSLGHGGVERAGVMSLRGRTGPASWSGQRSRQIARILSATWAPPRASGSRLSWEGLGAGGAMLPPVLLRGLGCLEGTTSAGVPGELCTGLPCCPVGPVPPTPRA